MSDTYDDSTAITLCHHGLLENHIFPAVISAEGSAGGILTVLADVGAPGPRGHQDMELRDGDRGRRCADDVLQ